MCQPLPGNRCSAHSIQRMANTAQRAKAYLDKHGAENREDLTVEQARSYDKLAARATQARDDYDSTASGAANLAAHIRLLDDTVDSREENAELLSRLRARKERGAKLREARRNALARVKLATLEGKRDASTDSEVESRVNRLVNHEISGVPRNSDEYAVHKASFLNGQLQARVESIRSQNDTYRGLMQHISKEITDSEDGTVNPRLYELCKQVSSAKSTRERERDALKARIIQLNLQS